MQAMADSDPRWSVVLLIRTIVLEVFAHDAKRIGNIDTLVFEGESLDTCVGLMEIKWIADKAPPEE